MIKDIALGLVALYGAGLSTVNWLQARQKDVRKVKVTMTNLIPTYYDGGTGPVYAQLTATNIGHRPVTITLLTFALPNNRRIFKTSNDLVPGLESTSFPIELKDGQSANFQIAYHTLANALRDFRHRGTIKLLPVCEDSAGNTYFGKPWIVEPDKIEGF